MKRTISGVFAIVGLFAAFALASASPAEMRGDMDCADFDSQAAAQNFYESQGPGDPHGLDADNDGVACETNPCPCSDGGGGGGGGGGGAPPPPPPPPPDPIQKEKLCGKFVGISGSRVCLKAITKGDKLKQVNDFKFRGLPAQCGDGSKPNVTGKDSKIDGDGKRFRSKHPKILGGFNAVDAVAVGKLKDGGSKAKGEVRVRANKGGAACNTRARKWKAD